MTKLTLEDKLINYKRGYLDLEDMLLIVQSYCKSNPLKETLQGVDVGAGIKNFPIVITDNTQIRDGG